MVPPMARSTLATALLGALLACRRTPAPTAVVDDSSDATVAAGAPDAGPPPACRVSSRQTLVRGAVVDAGDAPLSPFESTRAVVAQRRRSVSWVDARTARVTLRGDGSAPELTRSMGGSEHSDPSLALVGSPPVPVIAWTHDLPNARRHVVRWGDRLERGCQHPETRDEGLSLSAATTSRGLLVAWDDDGPRPAAGSIKVQLVEADGVAAAEADSALRVCAPPTQLSPAAQDASDPVLASTPEGGAVLVWLTARDLSATQANDTVTDLWAIALDPAGRGVGGALRLTDTLGHRFGVAVSVGDARSAWVAFRVSDESDSEARGDGGEVVVVRIERGPAGLTRASDPWTVTQPGMIPSGAPALFARGAGAQVFLRHRQGPAVTTLRRAVRPRAGGVEGGDLSAEPALAGRLPSAQEHTGHLLLPWTDERGALELVRAWCEPSR